MQKTKKIEYTYSFPPKNVLMFQYEMCYLIRDFAMMGGLLTYSTPKQKYIGGICVDSLKKCVLINII